MGDGRRQKTGPPIIGAALAVLMIGLFSPGPRAVWAQDTLRIGYSIRVLSDVNVKDARAAASVLFRQLLRHEKVDAYVETLIYEQEEEILRDLNSGFLHVISLVGHDYVRLAPKIPLDPVFVPIRDGTVFEQLLFLVAPGDTSRSLVSFRDRPILVSVGHNHEVADLWLRHLAREEKLPTSALEVEYLPRASNAVLPVLFRRAEGCIVFRSAYWTMVELNPQIGRELAVWRRSPEALMSVFCLNPQVAIPAEKQLLAAIRKLPGSPEGRQLLDVFGVDGTTPFSTGYVEKLRLLMRDYADPEAPQM